MRRYLMDRISNWRCGDCEFFAFAGRVGGGCLLGPLVVVDDRICADFVLAQPAADATFCEACCGLGVIPERRDGVCVSLVSPEHKCEDCDGKGYVE
jgi:hypothetical protein